jgi:hypothetical protein
MSYSLVTVKSGSLHLEMLEDRSALHYSVCGIDPISS